MPNTRSDAEKELHKKVITDLYLKGKSQHAIADALGIHRHTVRADLMELAKTWKEESMQEISDQKAIEIEKINRVESEAWDAFQASKTKQVVVKNRDGAEVVNIESEGNPQFLRLALDCIEKRCKIFGITGDDDPKTIILNSVVVVPQNGRDNPPKFDEAEIEDAITSQNID